VTGLTAGSCSAFTDTVRPQRMGWRPARRAQRRVRTCCPWWSAATRKRKGVPAVSVAGPGTSAGGSVFEHPAGPVMDLGPCAGNAVGPTVQQGWRIGGVRLSQRCSNGDLHVVGAIGRRRPWANDRAYGFGPRDFAEQLGLDTGI